MKTKCNHVNLMLRLFMACVIITLSLSGHVMALAMDPDENFVQKIDGGFFESLKSRPSEPRAIFLSCRGQKNELIIYAVYENGRYEIFSKLGREIEKHLKSSIFNSEKRIFKTYRKNGSVFYEKGDSLAFKFIAADSTCEVLYVPYKINRMENDAFISDRGYLRAITKAGSKEMPVVLAELVERLFPARSVLIKNLVKYNRYYFDRPDYFGYINRLTSPADEALNNRYLFYPTHKITYNRNAAEAGQKHTLDMKLAVSFLRKDYPIISQDIRAKRSFVEDNISLGMDKLDQTDIGSAQNTYIYLSYGPGINYYDSPYTLKNIAIPSPRFVFDRNVLFLENAQFYPKNSWESDGTGIKRFYEINEFQKKLGGDLKFFNARHEEPVYMAIPERLEYLDKMNTKITGYGLLNDTTELIFNFKFCGRAHRGNPVNNELRLTDAVYPAFSSISLIVPAGTKKAYIESYKNSMAKYNLPEYIGGIHYRDYFIEAPASGDIGMRMAYLKFLLENSSPALAGIARSFEAGRGSGEGYFVFIKACETLMKKEGCFFFSSPAAKALQRENAEIRHAFFDYLRSMRTNETPKKIKKKYLDFTSLYERKQLKSGAR